MATVDQLTNQNLNDDLRLQNISLSLIKNGMVLPEILKKGGFRDHNIVPCILQ